MLYEPKEIKIEYRENYNDLEEKIILNDKSVFHEQGYKELFLPHKK